MGSYIAIAVVVIALGLLLWSTLMQRAALKTAASFERTIDETSAKSDGDQSSNRSLIERSLEQEALACEAALKTLELTRASVDNQLKIIAVLERIEARLQSTNPTHQG